MPSDDYTTVGGGGALKLKGAKVTKKKKRKDKADLEKNLGAGLSGKEVAERGSLPREQPEEHEEGETKTESERRHDELKKKRLLELAESSSGSKTGLLKTHKERVEELNTYLSKLSEHHDMPKIGPG